MGHHLKNNKITQPDEENVKPICQTKISKGPNSKLTSRKIQSVSDEGREKLKNKIYKRVKRVGVWVLSFVSSFLCGAFVAFVLW